MEHGAGRLQNLSLLHESLLDPSFEATAQAVQDLVRTLNSLSAMSAMLR